jgi:hypothetical protein
VDAATLQAAWSAIATAVATHAEFPPAPIPPDAFRAAATGEIDARIGAPPTRRVQAVGVLPVERTLAWLSITSDRLDEHVAGLEEVPIRGRWAAEKLLYQRIDLPWPFQDRHWVLQLRNNAALAAACGAWERSWHPANDSMAEARTRTDTAAFDASLRVDDNLGGWILVPVGGQTLAVYQAHVSLGGSIPDGALASYVRSQVEETYRGVTENARDLADRYGPGCSVQPGGDGAPIPCRVRSPSLPGADSPRPAATP